MFKHEKVLEVISYLLSINENKMDKLKLIKELYLIDRLSIDETNMSVTGDKYFSLSNGPVLSNTLNIINDIPNNNDWCKYLKLEPPYNIKLIKVYNKGLLSKKDKEYIETISEKYKNWSVYELHNYTYTLPELKEPHSSNHKIHFTDIMKALGKDDEEIKDAKEEYKSITRLYKALNIY